MFLWPDHLTCPDLERWLPTELAEADVRTYVHDPVRGWRLPSGLRTLAQRWEPWSEDDVELEAVVVLSPLTAPVPLPVLGSVAPSGRVVDVSTIPQPLRWWLRPWGWRANAGAAAAMRVPAWKKAGLCALEQYIALAPLDAVVTLGRR